MTTRHWNNDNSERPSMSTEFPLYQWRHIIGTTMIMAHPSTDDEGLVATMTTIQPTSKYSSSTIRVTNMKIKWQWWLWRRKQYKIDNDYSDYENDNINVDCENHSSTMTTSVTLYEHESIEDDDEDDDDDDDDDEDEDDNDGGTMRRWQWRRQRVQRYNNIEDDDDDDKMSSGQVAACKVPDATCSAHVEAFTESSWRSNIEFDVMPATRWTKPSQWACKPCAHRSQWKRCRRRKGRCGGRSPGGYRRNTSWRVRRCCNRCTDHQSQ